MKVSRNFSTPRTSRVSATMDRHIRCSRLPAPKVDNLEDELMSDSENKTDFPHAVLHIRWDNNDSPRWLEELNGSHLIERVNNFSIYVHAVASLTSQTKSPYWVCHINIFQIASPGSVDGRCHCCRRIYASYKRRRRGLYADEIVLLPT